MDSIEDDIIFEGFVGRPDELISLLQATQKRDGFLSPESIHRIANFVKMSENTIYGVASFYSQFRFLPPGKNVVRVCLGTACHVQGARQLSEEVERDLGIRPGETSADGKFDFQEVACLGCCAQASVVEINGKVYGKMTPTQLNQVLKDYENLSG